MRDSKRRLKVIIGIAFYISAIWGVGGAQYTLAADSTAVDIEESESAVDVSNRIIAEITAIQEEIAAAETTYGPFHAELLEPMKRMISLQVGLENYQDVDRLIDRYLQISRINQNLSSYSQLPALVEQISNDIRLEQWESINNRFQFMAWIFEQHSSFDTEDLLSLLDEFAAWNLAAVYMDIPKQRAEHFMDYRVVMENAVDFAEREYESGSAALIPWLYRSAIMEYRGMTMQRTGDELRLGPSAGSLDDALSAIRRIGSIVDQFDNPEAAGMALVYEADFIKLANDLGRNKNYGSSDALYRQAAEKFHEIGLDEEKISAFFKQPTILPMNKFYTSIDSAMQEQRPIDLTTLGIGIDTDIKKAIEFTAWNESLRFTRRPEKTSLIAGLNTELNSVLLQFSLDKHGNARSIDAVYSSPNGGQPRAYARNAVERFTFRSNPTANRWRSEKRPVNLLYQYTP
ncbi:MAG: hypothetical protein COB20_06055 [SAR86 cluster bacterium]|uniref:TonB C-terminal domain-containing protein n=1 Tax=SAR86 cluster bacterium TaxID=2030880 RepID=A0A2A4X8M6_9GAMM|nr:MAG: hypothetical protein COB20_06055 [SAR86 cluster bacterium]